MAPEPVTPPPRGSRATESPTTTMMDEQDGISPVRRRTQMRIRSMSCESAEDLQEAIGPFGVSRTTSPKKKPMVTTVARDTTKTTEPQSMMACIGEMFQNVGEAMLEKAEPQFPMLTAHVEFVVYGMEFAFRSVRWFQFGFTAVYLGFRLIVYSIILLPAFLRIAYAYFHDPRIKRRIRYGREKRNYVDLYVPREALAAVEGKGEKVPVVIAVMGGAWVMGHRAWNAQLGLRLMDFGVLVIGVDYRNFPFAYVPEMVEDVNRGISWVFNNIEAYGGDRNNIMLIGQSAGAHLSALLLLEHSLLEARGEKERWQSPSSTIARRASGTKVLPDNWSTKDLKMFLGISGPYDLVALEPHLISRGIYHRILYTLTGDGDLKGCSPTRVLKESDWRANAQAAATRLPPITLMHGGKDKTVPAWSSKDLADTLKDLGVKDVTMDYRPDYTHTFPVIEGPMAGEDPQVELILPVLFGKEKGKKMYKEFPGKAIWPQYLLDMASVIMPY